MTEFLVAGVDEVGRGAIAGPVLSAAVILSENNQIEGLADSKALNVNARQKLDAKIKRYSLCWAIGTASVKEIEQINILQATLLAMKRAVELLDPQPQKLLVDGTHLPDVSISAQAIIKGDSKIAAISAASIVAKVARDKIMEDYSNKFPQYGFERHVGYATKYHLNALKQFGACKIHRHSFEPIRSMIETHLHGLFK